jgi:hypothetical protein
MQVHLPVNGVEFKAGYELNAGVFRQGDARGNAPDGIVVGEGNGAQTRGTGHVENLLRCVLTIRAGYGMNMQIYHDGTGARQPDPSGAAEGLS